ncbi:uncharacterized protein LOC124193767 [Daphnia pulex]|uniref:uncharacterized protein LOC124193767 n=1 Tax=Daphnia pulex TaxID=6669 RepID=UPI001EDCF1B1|nr:uncharacterized protein LOC124193767 [Daphnia pulex]
MKICVLLAIVACATAFVLPKGPIDTESLINDAHKAVQESDLPESVKLELANLLGDPQFVEQLIADNMESLSSSFGTDSDAGPAERCLFLLALLLAQLAQALIAATTTTTVATTTTAAG